MSMVMMKPVLPLRPLQRPVLRLRLRRPLPPSPTKPPASRRPCATAAECRPVRQSTVSVCCTPSVDRPPVSRDGYKTHTQKWMSSNNRIRAVRVLFRSGPPKIIGSIPHFIVVVVVVFVVGVNNANPIVAISRGSLGHPTNVSLPRMVQSFVIIFDCVFLYSLTTHTVTHSVSTK